MEEDSISLPASDRHCCIILFLVNEDDATQRTLSDRTLSVARKRCQTLPLLWNVP